MGTIQRLTILTAAAALLGLATSAWVRTHFAAVASVMTPSLPRVAFADDRTPSDGPRRSTDAAEPESTTEAVAPAADVRRTSSKHSSRRTRPTLTKDAFSENLDRGIRKLGESRYEIKRSTLDLALGNLGFLSRSVRVEVALRNDKPLGFRLLALQADGPVAKLGLRNGDVLVSINGLDISTPDRVLDACGKLRTSTHLVLGLIRDGREIRQEYAVR